MSKPLSRQIAGSFWFITELRGRLSEGRNGHLRNPPPSARRAAAHPGGGHFPLWTSSREAEESVARPELVLPSFPPFSCCWPNAPNAGGLGAAPPNEGTWRTNECIACLSEPCRFPRNSVKNHFFCGSSTHLFGVTRFEASGSAGQSGGESRMQEAREKEVANHLDPDFCFS